MANKQHHIKNTTDEEIADTKPHPAPLLLLDPEPDHPRTWRLIIRVGTCCSALIALLGLIMLVLAFTAFKVKNPVLTLNNVYIKTFQLLLSPPTNQHPLSINATLLADISILNPNMASLRFDSSDTEFYYMGQTVGVGYAPWAELSARRTARMNVTVVVLVDRVGLMTNAAGSILSRGYVNLTSYMDVRGRVSVMGIFNREIEVAMNCSMSLEVPSSSKQVTYKVCQAYVQ